MRTITATTAFKMPLYGISLPLSAYPVSSTVFRNFEKLSCVNDSSRKQASIYYLINACFYLTDIFPVANTTLFLIFKAWFSCALKNCINPFLQPRNPVVDYRGVFCFKANRGVK